MHNITAIILTYNEEKNIRDCIDSIRSITDRVIVIDSFSTDKTEEICKSLNVEFYQNVFINHASQFQFALDKINIESKWILKIDADERLTDDSAKEILELCTMHSDDSVNGIILRFKIFFLGKFLKHGGSYPIRKLVVFKKDHAHIEQKNMDEHIVLDSGSSIKCKKDSIHYDFKNLFCWIEKHNTYSTKETMDYFDFKKSGRIGEINNIDNCLKRKNKVKFGLYYKLPLFLRCKLYYFYRYIIRFGFLDGRQGKIYAFLQAYWYRFLVDAKIFEDRVNKK